MDGDRVDYQEYRQAWKQNPKDHILSRMPLHLDIELNTTCNRQCSFCPNHSKYARYPPKMNGEMEWSLYKKIIDEVSEKGVCSVKLCFRGEPLLYENLPLAIMYAKKRGIMDVSINTNGLLLDRAMSMDLCMSKLDLLILSDYSDPLQEHTLKILNCIKNTFKFTKPKIIIHSNNTKKWQGMGEVVEMMIHDYNSGEECFDRKEFECEQLYQRLVVLFNGNVKMCCSSVDFLDGIIGNIHENTIEELWNGEYMTYMRWCHREHIADLIKSCRFCPGFITYKGVGGR